MEIIYVNKIDLQRAAFDSASPNWRLGSSYI
jgi:hypothetical protein